MLVVARILYYRSRVHLIARCHSALLCSMASIQSQLNGTQKPKDEDVQEWRHRQEPLIDSPARIRKLIVAQSDPLLAKEIFDLALHHPNFRHSYATYHVLIIKLGRARHFDFMESLLSSLKCQQYVVSSSLFSHIIKIYGEAGLPDRALKTFYTIIEFNMKLSHKHLNQILEILVAYVNFIQPAFDLFKEARFYGVCPNTKSYNILMRAFSLNDKLSIAYSLFNYMLKRDVLPDVESYRILMQGLCRKGQVNRAVDLLEDMLNKGFVPDTLIYTTLLNSLCRKKKLKEAYKLLSRMKVKDCNPDIVHYNTVILGFCREGRAHDACKVLSDMSQNGCLPNLVSYRALVSGLCNQGKYADAKIYIEEMLLKGFSPHFSLVHVLVRNLCSIGLIDEASKVLENLLQHGDTPVAETWLEVISRVCVVDDTGGIANNIKEVMKMEVKPYTKLVEVGAGLQEYLTNKLSRSRKL
ncbi:hypothetical protein LIER_32526 [Lithospermum erythrorhizon]|uniref:Pentatricopeptide repeat-containing protein n=1 Tax=Lithospermum erythrorhizon TaxID=34254 RepID=A0AAV3RU43_LITER